MVQSLTCSTFTIISSPCHRPCHNYRESTQSSAEKRIKKTDMAVIKEFHWPHRTGFHWFLPGAKAAYNQCQPACWESHYLKRAQKRNNETNISIWYDDFVPFYQMNVTHEVVFAWCPSRTFLYRGLWTYSGPFSLPFLYKRSINTRREMWAISFWHEWFTIPRKYSLKWPLTLKQLF